MTEAGGQRLPDLHRYLLGIQRRLDRLPQDPRRDAERMVEVQRVTGEYRDLVKQLPPGTLGGAPAALSGVAAALTEIRWMIEELRVSLFAQALGTAYPVSAKRIYRALDEIDL